MCIEDVLGTSQGESCLVSVISDIATDVILERCTQQCLFDQLCI